MGSTRGRPDEQPVHQVVLAPFHVSPVPVSNEEYSRFVAAGGGPPPRFSDDPTFAVPSAPVVGLSWHEAVAYCEWLGAETGSRFRLPTEAEREFAARGGLEGTDWPWGDAPPKADGPRRTIAMLNRPHPPTPDCANGFGLMCMADNVHEWCSDWYSSDYYSGSPAEAPPGPASGSRRASRGGSWRHAIKFTRVSARSSLDPAFRYNDYGFRVYSDW